MSVVDAKIPTHSLTRSRRARLAFPSADVGRLAGDIRTLRAIISNCRYDGLIGSCGALEQALGAKAQIVLSPGRHGLSRALP
jgi:hypothetical protein